MNIYLLACGIILLLIAIFFWSIGNSEEHEAASLYSQFAHDVSKPLKTISLNLEGLDVDDAQQKPLDLAKSSLKHLTHLVENNLVLSLIGKEAEKREMIDIVGLCQKAVELVSPASEREDVDISIHAPSTSPDIWGNEEQLVRMLYNLLDNAIKFKNPENPSNRVEIKIKPSGRTVILEVEDNGLGILNTNGLFQPYATRQANTMHIEGTGVGLKLVYDVIQQHGGRIIPESTPKLRTTFTITLPIAKKWPNLHLNR